MYAIITDGGRQYRVQEGQQVEVDYRKAEKGSEISFDVLAVSGEGGIKFGSSASSASVTGEVLGVTQGTKIFVQKLRRRKNSRRRTGHRQMYTKVRIKAIAAG